MPRSAYSLTTNDQKYLHPGKRPPTIFRCAPGTGKAVRRQEIAVAHARGGRAVLFTCFNRVLASTLRGVMASQKLGDQVENRIVITHVDELRKQLAGAGMAVMTVRAFATTVVINEVESNQGEPGDWVELYNTGPLMVDLSGYIFRDTDDAHGYAVPAGSEIGAGEYLVLDEVDIDSAWGSADSARLFAPDGTLIDSYAWNEHAVTTYGRCPDGAGDFTTTESPTKGAANDCAAVEQAVFITEWMYSGPGGDTGSEIDFESIARSGDLLVIIGWHGNNRSGEVRTERRIFLAATITGLGANTEVEFRRRYNGLWAPTSGTGTRPTATAWAPTSSASPSPAFCPTRQAGSTSRRSSSRRTGGPPTSASERQPSMSKAPSTRLSCLWSTSTPSWTVRQRPVLPGSITRSSSIWTAQHQGHAA